MSLTNIVAGEDVNTEEVGVSFLKGTGNRNELMLCKENILFFPCGDEQQLKYNIQMGTSFVLFVSSSHRP